MGGSLQQKINKKYAVVKEFTSNLERIKLPMTFLVFGSVGRGKPLPSSDIDAMIVFRDSELAEFINDDFVNILPFDQLIGGSANIIKEADVSDLRGGLIDFLRLKGSGSGEKIEIQLFPFYPALNQCLH